MTVIDYYQVLGVSRDATAEVIRRRFRELARERHPDRFHGPEKAEAELAFQRLTQAANVLLDPERRRGHDMELFQPDVVQREEETRLLKMLMQRGRLAYQSRNFFEAMEVFERAVQEDSRSAVAWYYLARTSAHSRRWLSRGLSAIATAVKLEPTNADYLKLAGDLHARAKMTTRARRYYREARSWGADSEEIDRALARLDAAESGEASR